jgi:hypothetical protein
MIGVARACVTAVKSFYIGGVLTTLPASGTGVWAGHYYVAGVQTTLPVSGSSYYFSGLGNERTLRGSEAWTGSHYQYATPSFSLKTGMGLRNRR